MAYRYEIKEEDSVIAVYIYNEELQPEPLIYQPFWPTGETFTSIEDAKLWADVRIKEYDPAYEYMAPNSRNQLPIKKPTPQERAIVQLEDRLGMSIEDAKKLLGII